MDKNSRSAFYEECTIIHFPSEIIQLRKSFALIVMVLFRNLVPNSKILVVAKSLRIFLERLWMITAIKWISLWKWFAPGSFIEQWWSEIQIEYAGQLTGCKRFLRKKETWNGKWNHQGVKLYLHSLLMFKSKSRIDKLRDDIKISSSVRAYNHSFGDYVFTKVCISDQRN